ncbi:23S rRNA (uracil(1939)-C(5))-methyltransferase RlmD [Candidatus Dependentiae bacterium]|nr:23S rRNA (uracil(1939)-C(5))-methyltransferase RlmD [Candidatus Dependentiae bacterium]
MSFLKPKKNNPAIVLKKNMIVECEILRTGYSCEGISQIGGFIVFIEDTLPGEKVLVKIIKITKKYAIGKLLEIIDKSPHRINPECDNSQCGGCQLIFADYDFQIELKKNIILSAFKQNAKLEKIPLMDFIKADNKKHYRNKVVLPITMVNDKIEIGFYAQRSHRVVNIDDCFLHPEITPEIINIVKNFISKNKIKIYNENTGTGLMRSLMIRTNESSSEIMIVFVINGDTLPGQSDIISNITSKIPCVKSIILCKNKNRGNVVMSGIFETIYGKNTITAKLCGYNFLICPDSFFQINFEQTEKLYNHIFSLVKNEKNNNILFDIYSGVSSIGTALSGIVKKIYCLESNPNASELAEKIKFMNKINNIQNIHGDSTESLLALINSSIIPDIVIFDPPRKGCSINELKTIAEKKIPKVIYVSCNPSTLSRDAKILIDYGYRLKSIQPVDMFPYTYHVETVAEFT